MPTPSTPGPSSTSPADRWWSAAHGDHELCIRQRIARRLDDHADRAFRTTRARRGSARLVTFLALFWLTGGLITLRFALAIRPRPGFRLGLAAAIAAVVGAVLVLLREQLSGVVDPDAVVALLGS